MKKKRCHGLRKDSLGYRRKYHIRECNDMIVLWNADSYIARGVADILRKFIPYCDSVGATPADFCKDGKADYQAWHDCMEEMLFAFNYCADERSHSDDDRETQKRVQRGLHLFAKYLQCLWV